MSRAKDCIDIVAPFIEAIAAEPYGDKVQVFGGVGSVALESPDVEILTEEKLVIAPKGLTLPQTRANGTLRDLDCLVMTTDKPTIDKVEEVAKGTIGDQLEISVFGLRNASQLREQVEDPIGSSAKVYVSDRYVIESEGRITEARKALFPFMVDVNPEQALETWGLVMPDEGVLPIPHPGATMLNYFTRSISGLRPKDAGKVARLTDNLTQKSPEVIQWALEGPGATQMKFARLLHTLREPAGDPKALKVGEQIQIEPCSLEELLHSGAFMIPKGRPKLMKAIVEAARLKSRLLHFGESQESAVAKWQTHVEPRIGAILKNEI